MPTGAEAKRQAALAELGTALSAIRCAASQLELTAPSGRERELLRAINQLLTRAETSVQRLVGVTGRR